MRSVSLLSLLPALPAASKRPLGAFLRASAAAGASSAAPVSDVWAVLADPQRWPQIDPFLRAVRPAAPLEGEADGEVEAGVEAMAGQQVLAEVRLLRRNVAVEVDHVVNRSSLVTTAQLFHGLAEEVEHLLIPQASGGTLVTARITLRGPLALPALLPRWLFRELAVRLLAHVAEGELRAAAEGIPSVA